MGFRFYTNDGKHQVTLRVSGAQLAGWTGGAARRGMKLRPFIIWATDFACILARAIAEADIPEEERGGAQVGGTMGTLKTATFTVHATMAQSARWKQAAAAEGHASAGAWLARAADAYLRQQTLAGRPRPLAWQWSRFRPVFEGGPQEVRGRVSPPFGLLRGTEKGPRQRGASRLLVYLPSGRILAVLSTSRDCKALASELARLWVRSDGEPDQAEQVRALLATPRP